jgi:hypothetical protein
VLGRDLPTTECNEDIEIEVHLTVMFIEMDVAEIGLIEKRSFY